MTIDKDAVTALERAIQNCRDDGATHIYVEMPVDDAEALVASLDSLELYEAAAEVVACSDEFRERALVGGATNDLRARSNAAFETLRAAVAKARAEA